MATARNILTLALESMNKLSPGETLDADVSAVLLRRLNSIADDASAGRDVMPQDQITSGTVTGASLTLGTGSFAAVSAGDELISMTADNWPMELITIQQYQNIYTKTTQGRPQVAAWDGLSTVYLYPSASANVIGIVSRTPFTAFADLDTVYTMPAGYEGYFAACLAVAMAPVLIGKVTPDLYAAKRDATANIRNSTVRPAMLSSSPLSRRSFIGGNILTGWR